ncbi:hypothetical protein ACJX0J_012107, partial [Zea mays]
PIQVVTFLDRLCMLHLLCYISLLMYSQLEQSGDLLAPTLIGVSLGQLRMTRLGFDMVSVFGLDRILSMYPWYEIPNIVRSYTRTWKRKTNITGHIVLACFILEFALVRILA